jgi:hypothetical protein
VSWPSSTPSPIEVEPARLVRWFAIALFAATRPAPNPSAPAGATGATSMALVSKETTPTPSRSPSSSTNVGAASCSTSMRRLPGRPDGSSMLPERSSTSIDATVGLAIALALIGITHCPPVCGHDTVTLPLAIVLAPPAR